MDKTALVFSTSYSGECCVKGLQEIGFKAQIRHAGNWIDKYFERTDLVVTSGWRSHTRRMIECYVKNDIPCIVTDLGYVQRYCQDEVGSDDTYMQFGFEGTLNWLPDTAPTDRLEKLGIKYPSQINKGSDGVLIAGQWPKDANNLFSTDKEMQKWLENVANIVSDAGYNPLIRSHPRVAQEQGINQASLEDDLALVRCVITNTSNIGHDALLNGIPVICHPNAMYCGHVATEYGNTLDDLNDLQNLLTDFNYPTKDVWEKYFSRVAYGQWNFHEIKAGLPFIYYFDQVANNKKQEPDYVLPAVPSKIKQEPPVTFKHEPKSETGALANVGDVLNENSLIADDDEEVNVLKTQTVKIPDFEDTVSSEGATIVLEEDDEDLEQPVVTKPKQRSTRKRGYTRKGSTK